MTPSKISLFIAVVLFILAAFGVQQHAIDEFDMVAAGLAFFAASFLVNP